MDLDAIPVPDEANTQQYSPAEKELFEKQMDRFIYLMPRDWDCETADESGNMHFFARGIDRQSGTSMKQR